MRFSLTPLVRRVVSFYPHLKKDLRIAHLPQSPEEFVYRSLKTSMLFSVGLTILFFFIADKAGLPLIILLPFFLVCFLAIFHFAFLKVKTRIIQRRREIDREVLFVGQYLLLKLYSGQPLLNALINSTKSYGIASSYIKEIVNDIDTGNSLENALTQAMIYSPSEQFSKILFQINNALKLGIDVTGPLRNVLDEIQKEQEIGIKRYGRTLNSVVIFYMLGAIVIPSIGMTVFIVLSSFINFSIQPFHFVLAGFFAILLELLFIGIFRGIRPTMNI